MRTNKRKLMSLLLTFVLLLSLLPTTALAEEETYPNGVGITINGNGFSLQDKQYAASNSSTTAQSYTGSETYVARYDGSTGTLYLNGYSGGKISATNGSLSIVLEGENTVTVNGSAGTNFYGVLGNDVDLTIHGSGSLTVKATGAGTGNVCGISGKSVAIAESANVTVNAKTKQTATYAIYAQNGFSTTGSGKLDLAVEGETGNEQALYGIYVDSGDISLGGSGEKSITMKGAGGMVYGIHTKTSDKTTVSGGSLTIKSETSYVSPIAINAEGVVTLNADVTLTDFKYGVYNNAEAMSTGDKADIRIAGGTINITSTKTDSVGLWSSNNRVAVSGGTVNISTKASAIAAKNGGLDVTGSPTVTLTTEGSYASYVNTGTNNINLTGGSVTATSKGNYPIQGVITLGENTKVTKGEYYSSGNTCSGEANSDGSYTVEFAYEAPGAASAAVNNVTIEGTTNEVITDKEITVTLENAKFKAIAAGTDVTSWFTNLPAGLEAKIKTAVNENDTTATITVSGTPSVNSVEALAITIPAVNLVSGADLTVTGNADAKFNILTPITEATATVTAPVDGQHPSNAATSGDATKYTVTVTKWMTLSAYEMEPSDTFSNEVKYYVVVKFEAAAGYKFATDCTYKINGETATSGPNQACVTLEASAAPEANISLKLAGVEDETTNYFFDNETPLTVTITNSGTADTGPLTIALSGTNASSFELNKTSISDITASGTADFTVTPKTGLAAGTTYTATVKVSGTGAGVTEKSFTVNYTASGTTTSIAVPTANTGLIYDGTEKTGVNTGTGYTLSGTYTATDVSATNYTATATLNDGYKWNDNTVEPKSITWNIGKGTLTADSFNFVAPTNLEYDGSGKTASITLKSPLTKAGTITPTYMKDGTSVADAKDVGEYTVKIDVAAGDNFNAASGLTNDTWKFSITPATWGVPTEDLTAVNPTTVGGSDGKITGTTSAMQYRKSTDRDWTDCTGDVTGLTAGTYYVRYKADSNHNASDTNYKTLTLTDPGTARYSVTVTDGTATPSGNQAAGAEVTITAATKTGFNFKEWSGLEDSVYKSGSTKASNPATFIMPASAVNVTATYEAAALTGTASITGTAKYGEELTATLTSGNNTGNLDYKWYRNGTTQVAANNTGKYTLREDDIGKTITVKISSSVQTGEITSDATAAVEKADGPAAPDAFTLTFTLNGDGTTFTATIPAFEGGEYSFDGMTYSPTNTKTDCAANTSYTGYARIKETATRKTGEATSSTQTSPKLTVAAPTFTPNGAISFIGTQSVTIFCATAGAKIYYTTDGTTPTTSSTLYTTALSLTSTTTVKAIAVKDGMNNSAVAAATFTKYSGGGGGGGGAVISSVSDKAAKELKNAKEGSTVTIDMKGETELPASAIKDIAGKDITVELDMGGGMVWSFNGLDVPKGGVSLNLGVKTGTKTIPAKVINALTGETTTIQLQLDHNGPFGMSLNLSVDLGKKHDGMYANLYFYNSKNGELEFRSAGMIRGGKASWAFDHASDYAIVIDKESHEPMTFTDVADTAYYVEAVKWAVSKKITTGVGNDLFAPNQPCTRAQIVTFLWRAAGSPEPKAASSFADVTAGSYYAKAVAWAVENGITTGVGGSSFAPDQPCDRAQAVTFLFRALSAKAEGKAEFSDVPAGSYYADAVAWAAANGVTTGVGGDKFAPTDGCTRAQIVTFLYRAYNK